MSQQRSVAGFNALAESRTNSGHHYEEIDGSLRYWRELSPQSKLEYVAGDAVLYDVPFQQFAEGVRKILGDIPEEAREEAALRMVLHSQRELYDLEKLLPVPDRLESAPPLVERFKGILIPKQPASRNELAERLVDEVWSDFHDIRAQLENGLESLLEDHHVPEDVRKAVQDFTNTMLSELMALETEVVKLCDVPGAEYAGYGQANKDAPLHEIVADTAEPNREDALANGKLTLQDIRDGKPETLASPKGQEQEKGNER